MEATVQSCGAFPAEADTGADAADAAALEMEEEDDEERALLTQKDPDTVVFFAAEAIARGSRARQIRRNRSQCNPLTYSNRA